MKTSQHESTVIYCQSASDGIVKGSTLIVSKSARDIGERCTADHQLYSIADFRTAVNVTENQLLAFQQQVASRVEESVSMVFGAHLAILKDNEITSWIEGKIAHGQPAIEVIREAFGHYIDSFAQSHSPRLQEKVQDLRDIASRLIMNIRGQAEETPDYRGRILIVNGLFPSEILRYVGLQAAGIILTSGGTTAHISILARSLQVPMVLIDPQQIASLANNTEVLLDATQGAIFVEPHDILLTAYKAMLETGGRSPVCAVSIPSKTFTQDGRRIHLMANIGLLGETKIAIEEKAEGIGLYRSEIPFLLRDGFPSEDEQVIVYRRLIESMSGREVVIRTLDIGGDKALSYFPLAQQSNPFLGLRGIRFSMRHSDIFICQLRAILRSGVGHQLRILFPLISSVDIFIRIKNVVALTLKNLKEQKIPHNDRPELGAMIEMPSAVGVVEEIAAEADFLSIGTNDLVQYTLAVDRTNEIVSEWYVPWHPSVLRAIKRIIDAANTHGKPVAICGDLACDPGFIPVFIGMGAITFSVPPRSLRRVQEVIAATKWTDAQILSEKVLATGRISIIESLLGMSRKVIFAKKSIDISERAR